MIIIHFPAGAKFRISWLELELACVPVSFPTFHRSKQPVCLLENASGPVRSVWMEKTPQKSENSLSLPLEQAPSSPWTGTVKFPLVTQHPKRPHHPNRHNQIHKSPASMLNPWFPFTYTHTPSTQSSEGFPLLRSL